MNKNKCSKIKKIEFIKIFCILLIVKVQRNLNNLVTKQYKIILETFFNF